MNLKREFLIIMITCIFLVGCSEEARFEVTSSPRPSPALSTLTPTISATSPNHLNGCTVQTRRSQPNPTVESLLPAISEKDWTKGPRDAFVTILEYSDFQ